VLVPLLPSELSLDELMRLLSLWPFAMPAVASAKDSSPARSQERKLEFDRSKWGN
jgi:hypothetical protein